MIVYFVSDVNEFNFLTVVMLNESNMFGRFFPSAKDAFGSISDECDKPVAIYSAEIEVKYICELLSCALGKNYMNVQCSIRSKTVIERKQ